MRIGFLGLGQMGTAIALNLVRAGHEVRVWNRSLAKTGSLVEAGAIGAATPKDAALGAHCVISMLADDSALEAVLTGEAGLLNGLAAGAAHVSMSTIAVATADRVAGWHAERGQRFVAAPVFGRPEAAAAAKLYVVAAGDPGALEAAMPLLECVGQRVFRVGDTPSSANLVKLCGNFMILAVVEMMAEAMTLAEKGGVPKAKLLEIMTGTLFDAPIVRTYGALLVGERFRPAGFKAPLGLKDINLAGQAAEAYRVPMPLLSLLRDHLLETLAVEGPDIDWAGISRTVARHGGL